ncbi:hypothetical protein BWQ96_02508 [Gracilariopsis chorda]|uniref:Uncharacterized protein n=1 Tax=Gracilariopsis chorda TaxID=448386 RepID=A0A2V3J086_9FLOR|nr:hypothetical protein BWQ96_02508 [Gracilariopsis chorda]|eukprot:PXF47826.1 hypothetical protein BWQ96_02508 [Gracilariopsis chorda]
MLRSSGALSLCGLTHEGLPGIQRERATKDTKVILTNPVEYTYKYREHGCPDGTPAMAFPNNQEAETGDAVKAGAAAICYSSLGLATNWDAFECTVKHRLQGKLTN